MKVFLKKHFHKISITFLILVIILLSWIIKKGTGVENIITLQSYSYSDLQSMGFSDGYITISGTLVGEGGGSVGSPLNTNKITCNKDEGVCRLAQAEIFDGSLLDIYTETFDIDSWDKNFIVFKSQEGASSCVIWTYRIDRVKKEVIGVREKTVNYNSELCMGIGLENFTVKLVDGWDVVKKLRGWE